MRPQQLDLPSHLLPQASIPGRICAVVGAGGVYVLDALEPRASIGTVSQKYRHRRAIVRPGRFDCPAWDSIPHPEHLQPRLLPPRIL